MLDGEEGRAYCQCSSAHAVHQNLLCTNLPAHLEHGVCQTSTASCCVQSMHCELNSRYVHHDNEGTSNCSSKVGAIPREEDAHLNLLCTHFACLVQGRLVDLSLAFRPSRLIVIRPSHPELCAFSAEHTFYMLVLLVLCRSGRGKGSSCDSTPLKSKQSQQLDQPQQDSPSHLIDSSMAQPLLHQQQHNHHPSQSKPILLLPDPLFQPQLNLISPPSHPQTHPSMHQHLPFQGPAFPTEHQRLQHPLPSSTPQHPWPASLLDLDRYAQAKGSTLIAPTGQMGHQQHDHLKGQVERNLQQQRSLPGMPASASMPQPQGFFVQCDSCNKWRKLPMHHKVWMWGYACVGACMRACVREYVHFVQTALCSKCLGTGRHAQCGRCVVPFRSKQYCQPMVWNLAVQKIMCL